MAYPILQAKSHLTHYRTATVNSRKVFYREAGDQALPQLSYCMDFRQAARCFAS